MLGRTLPSIALRKGVRYASTETPRQRNIRRAVLTGSVALITVSGALTGAWLKSDGDTVKQKAAYQETTVADQIAILEGRRASLVAMKIPLERKLGDLRERMRVKKEREQEQQQGR